MTRIVLAVALALGLAACDKPSKDDCRKALLNMQHLMGTENLDTAGGGALEGEVRRCQGGSRKEAVACAIKATTMDELRRCDFYKVDEKMGSSAPAPTGSGSATAPAGSAGSAAGSGT
jgi:hypothetical protein